LKVHGGVIPKYHHGGVIPKSNETNVERGNINSLNTQIYDRSIHKYIERGKTDILKMFLCVDDIGFTSLYVFVC
jgi:hypothetical protein